MLVHNGKMITKSLAEKLTGVKLAQPILFKLAASKNREERGEKPQPTKTLKL